MKYENLKDKVVMITGASSGLGEALARAFAENGSLVYIGARNLEKLETIANELLKKGQKVYHSRLDVSNPIEVEAFAEYAIKKQGNIDIWINNAGADKKVSVFDLEPSSLQEITAVNYFGLAYGTVTAARHMKEQNYGDIVQILSTSVFTPRENEAAYCSAKAAADMYSRCAEIELKRYGIRMIRIEPGGMDTAFFQKAGLKLPQNAMDPRDIADMVLNAVSQPRNITAELRIFRNE